MSRPHLGLISASSRFRLGLASPRINLTSKTTARPGFELAGLGWVGWPGPDSALEIASRTQLASPRPRLGLFSTLPHSTLGLDLGIPHYLIASTSPLFDIASASTQPSIGLASALFCLKLGLPSSRLGLASFRQTRPRLGFASASRRHRLASVSPRTRLGPASPLIASAELRTCQCLA